MNNEAVSCEEARWGLEAIANGVWPETFAGTWQPPGRMANDQALIRAGRLTVPGIPTDRYTRGVAYKRNAITAIIEKAMPETVEAFERRCGDALIFEERDLSGPD